ncbi:MAG: methyl-accepting chemotaxis protein [Firmicutes bacterium]|nr:methyl-accepting chemotaxis protein [Bacillota bacterium]
MTKLKNSKIRTKLLISFGIIVLIGAAVSAYAVRQIYQVAYSYEVVIDSSIEARDAMQRTQGYIRDYLMITTTLVAYAPTGMMTNIEDLAIEADVTYDSALVAIQDFIRAISEYPYFMGNELDEHLVDVQQMLTLLDEFRENIYLPVLTASRNISHREALNYLTVGEETIEQINFMIESKLNNIRDLVDEEVFIIREYTNVVMYTTIAFLIGVLLVSSAFAIWVSTVISKPIRELLTVAESVSRGELENLQVNATTTDETGLLAQKFGDVVTVVTNLANDLHNMSYVHYRRGEIDTFLEDTKYPGQFGLVAKYVNGMVKQHIDTTRESLEVLGTIATHDFDAPMEELPGKKIFINEIIEATRKTCKAIDREISELISESLRGNLQARADVANFEGDWATTMKNMNMLLDSIVDPVQESLRVMEQIANGNLGERMMGNYKGDFFVMQQAINETVMKISKYIGEISSVLNGLADNDLNQAMYLDYIGDFCSIKDSFTTFIDTINEIMARIESSTDVVNQGVAHLADGSSNLAAGNTQQAIETQKLQSTISVITEGIQGNLTNIDIVGMLSVDARNSAAAGNEDLHEMVNAMDSINAAFNDISNILKTIEDIAFQTSLLALNASVEAARAGEYGKGFTVVAEEVRKLASKTQEAAQETADLIEGSESKVLSGVSIADKTTQTFTLISACIENLATVSAQISKDSHEQATAIEHFSNSLMAISDVVSSNSATSEEIAATSEQLSSQSILMDNTVKTFKLRTSYSI